MGAVQSVEQSTVHQVGGPDHRRGSDQEATADTTHGETDELGGHDHEPLVREVPGLVVEDTLHSDNVSGVSRAVTDGGHDGNKDVLLNSEGAIVEPRGEK